MVEGLDHLHVYPLGYDGPLVNVLSWAVGKRASSQAGARLKLERGRTPVTRSWNGGGVDLQGHSDAQVNKVQEKRENKLSLFKLISPKYDQPPSSSLISRKRETKVPDCNTSSLKPFFKQQVEKALSSSQVVKIKKGE
ncbi:hypothetical protein PIB30_062698 [Stylosanthes scabra]|uniref:Uncharacterized protein n=1 Tax=Stylosanthes scabra TaxID=79078 RepID=A0ABU6QKM8_9FABA|nr:hypothetical protein [Stylosanthes scabra]